MDTHTIKIPGGCLGNCAAIWRHRHLKGPFVRKRQKQTFNLKLNQKRIPNQSGQNGFLGIYIHYTLLLIHV